MRKTLPALAVLVALACAAAPLLRADGPAPRPQWEYRMLNYAMEDGEKPLNEAGKEGWELVAVTSTKVAHNAFLKRVKQP